MKKLVASLLLLLGIAFYLPLPENSPVMEGLDPAQVRLGLGFFVCIAFLWMTEALPLSITALLVPVLAVVMGLGGVKENLTSFANPLIFVFFGGLRWHRRFPHRAWIGGWRVGSGFWEKENSFPSRCGCLSERQCFRCG